MTQCTNFSITGVPMITVTAIITGTPTATFGTDAVTFTATVTNSGTASGTATVTFYIGLTTLGTPQPTGTISIPNGTGTVSIIINPSTWVVGTYSVCAKTNYE